MAVDVLRTLNSPDFYEALDKAVDDAEEPVKTRLVTIRGEVENLHADMTKLAVEVARG